MIITRWQAPIVPNTKQLLMILESEGLEPYEVAYKPQTKAPEQRRPFAEVRIVAAGEMIFNISGNQFVLRPGDRLEVPANTRYSYSAQGAEDCICICAQKAI